MKAIVTRLLVIFALALCTRASAAEPTDVSLLQLIANPRQFHGKLVRVIGYLRLEFEGNALYLHREDYMHAISRNGIWVNLPLKWPHEKAINNKYVIVEGVFDAKNQGHMGMFSGELSSIQRADQWSDPADPITKQYERSRKPK